MSVVEATFESLVVGDSNREVVAAVSSQAAAVPAGRTRHLAIEGPSGSGKSHLLAAAQRAVEQHGGSAYRTSARAFAYGYTDAIRRGEPRAVRRWLDRFELVLLDDLDDLDGWEGVQGELRLTMAQARSRYILAAGRFGPLSWFGPDSGGTPLVHLVRMRGPCREMRRRILGVRCHALGLDVDEGVLELADQLAPNAAVVVGYAQHLAFSATQWNEPCSRDLAVAVLRSRSAQDLRSFEGRWFY